MRALSSLLLAGAVAHGGLVLTPAAAEAHGGWRGRDYYQIYVPPTSGHYGYGVPGFYGVPRGYGYGVPGLYAPRGYGSGVPRSYGYGVPGFYGVPRTYGYGVPGFYGAPRSYGIPPGPGVGLWIR